MRGCGAPLERSAAALVCAHGHTFDRSRSGYVNLLGPQDSRARDPGDSREVVAARRALLDAGLGAALEEAVAGLIESIAPSAGTVVLDVGCGEGHFLAATVRRFRCTGWGLDLSRSAIDAAARRHPGCGWIVANADRRLPILDASVDLVLSITARRSAAEFARVLRPQGHVLIAVPAPDDLAELRAEVLGAAHARDRLGAVEEELGAAFRLVERRAARAQVRLEAPDLARLAAVTYRMARARQSLRLAALDARSVTTSHDLGLFARGGPQSAAPADGGSRIRA